MITSTLTDAIARIEVYAGKELRQRGTGFLVDAGHAVTALHVVADRSVSPPAQYGTRVVLRFGDDSTEATVLLYDTAKDWALLGLKTARKVQPIALARLDRPVDRCWMWGFAELNALNGKTFTGEILRVDAAFGDRSPMLEIDSRNAQGAPIGGLSGGPCFVQGRAIGLVQANLEEGRRNIAGALYALPIEVVVAGCRDLLPTLEVLELEWLRPDAPHQAERPPAWFVETPRVGEIAERIAATLHDRAKLHAPIVIWGAAGSGKTTIAAAVSAAIEHLFPDGTLWTTLGRSEERADAVHRGSLLTKLGAWVQEFDRAFVASSIDVCSRHMRSLLADRRCLLVIDDAWDPDAVEPFLVAGAKCRTIITTRRRDIAEALGGEVFEQRELEREQSLALLAARLGRPLPESEREMAARTAQIVGHLPLALVHVATAVGRGKAWSEIAQDLGAEVSRLESIEPLANLRRSDTGLEAVLNLSLKGLLDYRNGDRLHAAFAWLGVTPEDADLPVAAVARLWETDSVQGGSWLEILWNDALLTRATGEPRAYRLHDLWLDRARRLLTTAAPGGYGINLPKAHGAVLDRYSKLCSRPNAWWTVPDDGYIFDRLAWHLVGANRSEALHTLLAAETADGGNGWFQARERTHQLDRYVSDIDVAWKALDLSEDDVLTTERQLRYSLAIASLNSSAANIPAGWIVRLVAEKAWKSREAVLHALRIGDHASRARALSGLLPHLDDSERSWATRSAVRAAFTWGQVGDSSDTWLRERLPELLGPLGRWMNAALYREVLDVLFAQEAPMAALSALAPTLAEADVPRVLEFALKRGYDADTGKLLRAIKPRLAATELESLVKGTALGAEAAPENSSSRALKEFQLHLELLVVADLPARAPEVQCLAALLPFADWRGPELVSTIVDRASIDTPLTPLVDAALAVKNSYVRTRLLEELAPRLTGPDVRHVLASLDAPMVDSVRSSMLSALRAGLPTDLVLPAAEIARKLGNAGLRAAALAELSARGDAQTAQRLRDEALGISRGDALVALLPELSAEEFAEALDVLATRDFETRSKKLLAAAAALPVHLLPKALDLALDSKYQSSEVMAALVGRFSHDAIRIVIDRLRSNTDRKGLGALVIALAPHIPPDVLADALGEALEFVLDVDEGRRWSEGKRAALQRAAPYLAEDALRAICLVEYARPDQMLAVAPALKGEIWVKTLASAIQNLKESSHRRDQWMDLLEKLGEHAPMPLLMEGLRQLRQIGDQAECSRALRVLVRHLDEAAKEKVLTVALAIPMDSFGFATERTRALVALAPDLSPRLRERALAGAQALEWEGDRLDLWIAMLPLFEGRRQQDLAWEAFELARKAEMLEKYIDRITAVLDETHLEEAGKVIARESQKAAERARSLVSVARRISGSERIGLLQQAVESAREVKRKLDRRRLFQDLAPHLPESLRGTIEELADWQPEAKEVAAPSSRPEVEMDIDGALAAARGINDRLVRGTRLAGLVERVPETARAALVDECFQDIEKAYREERISERFTWWELEDTLRPLARWGSSTVHRALLEFASSVADPNERARALAALSRHTDRTTREKALIEAFRATNSIGFLIPDLGELDDASKRLLWPHALVALDSGSRAECVGGLVRLLAPLCPIGEVAGPRVAGKTILEAVSWWP